eukprot:CAMPEP_0178403510 /NCGR_PEP_ID=MMETSP0689_2-20121128/17405_1 /TAXON_ID=160604 /ORGANISM="Amphidinium massartii, Strain CS-259" /LENGTH=137 /DNA_ID=CAMNT_0020024465 /DNA_START=89 /DNA_END=502 /DNA_ORIENTATION=+
MATNAPVVQAHVVDSNEAPVVQASVVGEPVQAQPVQAQPVQATVIAAAPVQQGMGTGLPAYWGDYPTMVTCPHCGHSGSTQVQSNVSAGTHILALLICCFTGCCCIAVIPYVVDGCKEKVHTCTNCRRRLGVKKFLA